MNIIIDIYGADQGPLPILEGVVLAKQTGLDFYPILVGEKSFIDQTFQQMNASFEYEVIDTCDFIAPEEPPQCVFGGRNESSLCQGMDRLNQDDRCDALLSSGNTGALLIASLCRLGLCEGLQFPALASALPCAGDQLLCLVDCGANINCTVEDLVNYAKMGHVFCQCFCQIPHPKVGLMSVGREKGKGTPVIKQAYDAIARLDLNFVGNLEGSDMVSGYADVIVADGYAGNLLLKNTEAAGMAALSTIQGLPIPQETLCLIEQALHQRFNFNQRGAATFLGPKKTVVKMHGIADRHTVVSSIDQIIRLHQSDFCKKIAQAMKKG